MNDREKRELWVSLEEKLSEWLSEQHKLTQLDINIYDDLAGHMATTALQVAIAVYEAHKELTPPDES